MATQISGWRQPLSLRLEFTVATQYDSKGKPLDTVRLHKARKLVEERLVKVFESYSEYVITGGVKPKTGKRLVRETSSVYYCIVPRPPSQALEDVLSGYVADTVQFIRESFKQPSVLCTVTECFAVI